MPETLDLLDDLTALRSISSNPAKYFVKRRECAGCAEIKPDVDLWAEDSETGEQLWLCEACGE